MMYYVARFTINLIHLIEVLGIMNWIFMSRGKKRKETDCKIRQNECSIRARHAWQYQGSIGESRHRQQRVRVKRQLGDSMSVEAAGKKSYYAYIACCFRGELRGALHSHVQISQEITLINPQVAAFIEIHTVPVKVLMTFSSSNN